MSDPLSGQRRAINEGGESLKWKAGVTCPVKVGDVFELQTCGIEITAIYKIRTRGEYWGGTRAEFKRIHKEGKPIFLSSKGYTHDPKQAIKAQDDPNAATLDTVSPDSRQERHRAAGEPPEMEVVPPHEVRQLPSTLQAKARYLEQSESLQEEESRRRQERMLRAQLRDAMRTLNPQARLALLARIEGELAEAMASEGRYKDAA